MFAVIIRILALSLIIWLVRQMIAAIMGSGKAHTKKSSLKETGLMVRDPVCGMYLDSSLAICHDEHDKPVYFCSADCKSKYLAESGEK